MANTNSQQQKTKQDEQRQGKHGGQAKQAANEKPPAKRDRSQSQGNDDAESDIGGVQRPPADS